MSAAETTLVTGGSGFVGFAVARKLVESGHRVRALLRPTSDRIHLSRLGVEFAEGDLRDAEAVGRAMSWSAGFFTSRPIIGCGRATRRKSYTTT